ncbi:preprotein translocase subunit SecA [Patescibacteria group bacterium]|nr:preprotein translocase subunit SecA [Patescibacteria group bacterium]
MLSIFNKFLDSNQREINKFSKIVEQINALEKKYQKLSDKQLAQKTSEFKKLISKGTTIDELLPEAYAAVREAAVRTLGQRLFDVQLVAAIALHQGKIAEQKTGEGKTLSAVPALYLNSLLGRGAFLVTVNDYLSRIGCGWMGPVYQALGTNVAVIVHDESFIYDPDFKDKSRFDERLMHLKAIPRKEAYNTDITYGTNNEFGFDYLRDNMVHSLDSMVQREPYFAIVDEVDSILIDEARTPLIISAPAAEPTQKYYDFAKLIDKLSSETDYVIDEKQRTSSLTEHGTIKIEKMLNIDNLYEKDFSALHHIEQALKARALFIKDRDYVVKEGEVVIVDEFTGRLMPGRRYSEGLHQAIEAKEGVQIQQESQTLATISFQNYFRMFEKLAGMTGTAATEAEEFHKIYKLDVIVVPTNRPMVREDLSDAVYKTQTAKYTAVANQVEGLYKKGQPVLVGTTSIEKNEFLSELLKRKRIPHALLNAKNHEKEAEIISRAGEKGAVTVATNMAGRGVDIKLGKGVDKLGGLYVIGTERHESRRIDNQLRGRSGRQGDAGISRFYVSLEDDLMRVFGGDQVSRVMNFLKMPDDVPIEHQMVSKAIESAQVKVEGHNFDIRKTTVEYDDVMNQQRQIIYGVRKKILQAAAKQNGQEGSLRQDMLDKIDNEITSIVQAYTTEGLDLEKIMTDFAAIINFDPNSLQQIAKQAQAHTSQEALINYFTNIAHQVYEEREKTFGNDIARQMEIFVYLNTIDTLWIEHLDTMDDLRAGIGLRGYGQRDPLIEYKKEGFDIFEKLIHTIDYEVVHRIYKVSLQGPQTIQPQPIQVIERRPEIETGVATEKEEEEEVKMGEPLSQVLESEGSATKVTIERAGQTVSQNYSNTSNHQANSSAPQKKPGRNDPCWCGSGKKYKKCHWPATSA